MVTSALIAMPAMPVGASGRNPATLAGAMGDLSALEALVAEGERVDCHDEYGDTALHLAAMNGHIEAVYTLVTEYQVDVDIRNWELWTPLMWAVCRGHIEVAAYLVDKGASVAAQSVMGCTPMHLAAAMGHSHIVDWLLHEGADALIPDKFGMTPCSWACGSEAKATLQHIEELSRDVVKPRPMLEKSRFRSSLPDSAAAAAAAAAAKAALVRAEAAIAPAASDVAQPPGTVFSASALKTRSTHQQMNSNPVMRLRHLSVGPEAASSLQQATQHVLDSNEAEPDPAASPVAQQPHSLAASRLASPTAAMHDNDSADGQPGTRDTLAQPFQARSSHGSGGRSVAEAEPESHGEKSASLPQRPKLFGVETLSSEGGAVGSIKDATHRGVSEEELPAGVSASAALTKDRLVPVQQRHRSLADSTTGDIEAQQAESGLVLELEKAQDSATMAPNAVDSLDAPQLADDSDSSTSVSSTDSESVIQDFLRKLEGDGFPCPQPDAEAGLGPGLLSAESSGRLDDDSSSLESTADAAES